MRLWKLLVIIVVLLAGVSGAFVAGFYVNKLRVSPAADLIDRAEARIRREAGFPSETVASVSRVNTIFLRLRGKVYPMPGNDFQNGGGLTRWGEDVLTIHKSGRIFFLDPQRGLVLSDVRVPDNGVAAYRELANTDEFATAKLDAERIRFNDIEFIESAGLKGLVVSYTYVNVAERCYSTRVSWLDIDPSVESIRETTASSSDWRLVFETSPCLPFNETGELIVGYMAGGRVAFKDPDTLFLGSGDYHLDGIYRPDAGIQSLDSQYGKTLAINLRSGEASIYSVGHRNLQGVALDRDGRLWVTEHGMRGGDELNLVAPGNNYGWPLDTLGTLYSGAPLPSNYGVGRLGPYEPPVFAWLPSAAVSSLEFLDGFDKAWDGDLLIGSLRARTLFRARIKDDRILFMEQIYIGQRIRDVLQLGRGRLALWLDTNELVILEVEERGDPLVGPLAKLESELGIEMAERTRTVLDGCSECHSFEADIHQSGPSLYRVFNRRIASTAFGSYSQALKSVSGSWDEDNLLAFLQDTAGFADGTSMPQAGLSDEALARSVVRTLELLQ